jgi:two-component system, NarL family, sensor histidine kinase DegS
VRKDRTTYTSPQSPVRGAESKQRMPEGIKLEDVEAIRQEVEAVIDEATAKLAKLETRAHQRLQDATVEQQRLENFLDEMRYRLQVANRNKEEGGVPRTFTGPLTEEQLNSMQVQEETLQERRDQLIRTNVELQQVHTRLSWLIHQVQGACAWVVSNNNDKRGENDSRQAQGAADEQVMLAQIIMGQEAERARLAREIHDGPAQALANTVMRLQWVEQLYKHQPDQVGPEIGKLRTAVQESLRDVRRFIFNLRPASLSDVGLVPTLNESVRDYANQYQVDVELNVPETLNLSQDQELVVFRIVQEALQNIHKHAEATHVRIDIQQRSGGPLVVEIKDDGKGFSPKQVRQIQPSSSGLVNMRERAATVGGTLQIDSTPGAGTTITLTLPMPKM